MASVPATLNSVNAATVSALKPTISFEVMPPRRPHLAPIFWGEVTKLISTNPDFISVTYGAAGGDRETALSVVNTLVKQTPTLPIAHLTCVGASKERLDDIINDFLETGARTFLALRGDPPMNQPDWQPEPNSVQSAIELIHRLRVVNQKRCHRDQAAALRSAAMPLTIAVATFLDGNFEAGTTREQEIEHLLEKQQAGANFAITQLFYRAESYIGFVEDAKAAGVTIPILAGILPMTEIRRLTRVEELTGVPAPQEVIKKLATVDDLDEQHDIGIAETAKMCKEVLASGAPGLHIYTYNKSRAALDLLDATGLRNKGTLSPATETSSATGPGQPDLNKTTKGAGQLAPAAL